MLKKRVIPVLLFSEGRMVKGVNFANYRETGLPASTIRIYSAQDADELCFINIDRSVGGFQQLITILTSASHECFMPLTAGGGVTHFDHVSALFNAGADKVLITSALFKSIHLLKDCSQVYGNQSIVAGIDYYLESSGPVVALNHGSRRLEVDLFDYALAIEQAGAGEIFLNCISFDGMMNGYDLETASKLGSRLSIPLVLSGGAGDYQHLRDALLLPSISAVGCASLFHFGDNTPIRARSYLRNAGIPMRVFK